MLKGDLDSTKADIESLKNELRYQNMMRGMPWGYGMPMAGMPPMASADPAPAMEDPEPESKPSQPRPEAPPVLDGHFDDDDDEGAEEGAEEPPETPSPPPPPPAALKPPEKLFAPERVREKAAKRPAVKQLILPDNLDDAILLRKKK